MSAITREQVHAVSDLKAGYILGHADVAILNELARIALASLEVEPVAYMYKDNLHADARFSLHTRFGNWSQEDINEYEITEIPLYTAPPAPVSVPDAIHSQGEKSASDDYYALGWNACRAAMLQGADNELQRKAAIHDSLCEKYNVESLADFVDWQRNHIAELEAAPPAPAGQGETAVMPDYPGYVMTQRECYQAGKKVGLAEAGNSPVIPTQPLAWKVIFTMHGQPGSNFKKIFEDEVAMESAVSLHRSGGFNVQVIPLIAHKTQ